MSDFNAEETRAMSARMIKRWGEALRKLADWPCEEHFGPAQSCPECDSPIEPRGWSGVQCTKCNWWWCMR